MCALILSPFVSVTEVCRRVSFSAESCSSRPWPCTSRELVHVWLRSITDALLSKSDALPVRCSPWPDCMPPSLVDRHPLYPSVCPISTSPSHLPARGRSSWCSADALLSTLWRRLLRSHQPQGCHMDSRAAQATQERGRGAVMRAGAMHSFHACTSVGSPVIIS